MAEDFVEGLANTIEITLKSDVEVVQASPGEILSRLGIRSLDSMLETLVTFSSPLVIKCVDAKKKIFRIIFTSNQVAQLQPNASLLEANENIAEAR